MNSDHTYLSEELFSKIKKLEAENEILRKEIKLMSDSLDRAGNDSRKDNFCFKEKYAKEILDSLPDMLTVIDRNGTLVELVSSEETNHVGMPGSEITGKNISDIIPPEAYRNVKSNLDWVVRNNKGSIAHHDLTVDGNLHHYENRIFPLDGENVLCMCRDVTESAESKEELELANKKMKMAEDIASLSHWYFYPETGELEAPGIIPQLLNAANEKCRLKIDEYLEYVHSGDRDRLEDFLLGNLSDSDVVEHRISIRGKLRYFHTRVICCYEKDGAKVLEGYAQDMTYIVERLHELEMVKYAVNNAAEEIFSCTMDGTLEFANINFIEHQGITSDFSRYKIYELGISISGLDRWNEKVLCMRNNNGSLKYTAEYKSPCGKKQTFEVAAYIIRDQVDDEKIWFFSRDITERVDRENKIRKLNTLMDAILNNIPVYLFVKDPADDFRYLYWNKAFEEHSHIPASSVLGKTDFEIFPNKQDAGKFRNDDLKLLKNKERIEFIEDYVTATGETRIVSTSKALVPSENEAPWIIGVSWDLTEMKNIEKELIAARIKAEQSDRLKTAFLANMSHEIRTPLNAIVGFSKLIADADSIEEKNEYSEIINRNSEMLLQLINDILDISKIEAGSLEFISMPMDLGDLCRNLYEVHKNRIPEGVCFILDNEDEHVHILGDYNRISQVLTNFITNACKFTRSGEIRFGYKVKGNELEVYVKDTGIGISAEKLPTIFERFIKLDSFAQGTGLGLAISKMIVEKMDGTLTVESQENQGSVFRFTIPYIKDNYIKQLKEKDVNLFQNKSENAMKKLLIAEDVDSNFLLLKAVLGKKYELIRAVNGKEAILRFNEHNPDLIFMDIKMPEMDGLEASKIIRSYSQTVPIIALTAFAFDSDKEKALSVGCNDFLTKPISIKELRMILDQYLEY